MSAKNKKTKRQTVQSTEMFVTAQNRILLSYTSTELKKFLYVSICYMLYFFTKKNVLKFFHQFLTQIPH